ncbi:hypothetical protein L6452_31544 [Arctium lappa]|uniref:Uncharacterized protein n=1 Tax=Arctium lappa TaxID=4217 RepID=A0ACB8Z1R3_ARCLA|nr:hypothetical protein L6452_31544 [Arctium lappa]
MSASSLLLPHTLVISRTLFLSVRFSPLSFNNFIENQAECLVKRTLIRDFHIEKRQSLLVLCWQRRELVSASAWSDHVHVASRSGLQPTTRHVPLSSWGR